MTTVMKAASEFFPPNDRELALRGVIHTGWSTVAARQTLKGLQLPQSELQKIKDVLEQSEALEKMEEIRIGIHMLKHKQMVESCRGDGVSSCLICGLFFSSQKARGPGGMQLCQMCGNAVCQRCKIFSKTTSGEFQILCRVCADKKELWKRSGAWLNNTMPAISISEEELTKAQEQQHVSKITTLGRSRDTLPREFVNPYQLEAEDSETDDEELDSSSCVSGSQPQLDFTSHSREASPFSNTKVVVEVKSEKTIRPGTSHTLPREPFLDKESPPPFRSRSNTEGSPQLSPARELSRKGAMSNRDKSRMDKARQRVKTRRQNQSASSTENEGMMKSDSISSVGKDFSIHVLPEIKVRKPSISTPGESKLSSSVSPVIEQVEEGLDFESDHRPVPTPRRVKTNEVDDMSIAQVHNGRQGLKRQPELDMMSQAFDEFKKVGGTPKRKISKEGSPPVIDGKVSEPKKGSPLRSSYAGERSSSPAVRPSPRTSSGMHSSPPLPEKSFSYIPKDTFTEFRKVSASPRSTVDKTSSPKKSTAEVSSTASQVKPVPRSRNDSNDDSLQFSTPKRSKSRENSVESEKRSSPPVAEKIPSTSGPVKPLPRAKKDTSSKISDSPPVKVRGEQSSSAVKPLPRSTKDTNTVAVKADSVHPVSVSTDKKSLDGTVFSRLGREGSVESTEAPVKPVPRSRKDSPSDSLEKPFPAARATRETKFTSVSPVKMSTVTEKQSSSTQSVKPVPRSRNDHSSTESTNKPSPAPVRALPRTPPSPQAAGSKSSSPKRNQSQSSIDGFTKVSPSEQSKKIPTSSTIPTTQPIEDSTASTSSISPGPVSKTTRGGAISAAHGALVDEFRKTTAVISQRSAEASTSLRETETTEKELQAEVSKEAKDTTPDVSGDYRMMRRKNAKRVTRSPRADTRDRTSQDLPEDVDGSPQMRGRSRAVASVSRPRSGSGSKDEQGSRGRLRSSAISGMQRPKRFQQGQSPLKSGDPEQGGIQKSSSIGAQVDLEFPRVTQRARSQSPAPDGLCGSIEVNLTFQEELSQLKVTIIKCKGLRPMDSNGLSDPYVNLFLIPGHRMHDMQTEIHFKTLNPEFNESFVFEGILKDSFQEKQLCLVVMDYDEFSKDDFIGATRVNLYELLIAPTLSLTLRRLLDDHQVPQQRLEDKSRGKLQITAGYSAEVFTVGIVRAKHILHFNSQGQHCNPFVKCHLDCKGRIFKRKTKVCRKTINPEFNEEVQFPIKLNDLPFCRMTVTVLDHKKLKDTFLGEVHFESISFWKSFMSCPSQVITDWYGIEASSFSPDRISLTYTPTRRRSSSICQKTIVKSQSVGSPLNSDNTAENGGKTKSQSLSNVRLF